MKTFLNLTGWGATLTCAIMASLPFTALATDFDEEGIVVDGIKYGIVGTEAPYQAYVVEPDMFEPDDPEYEGDIVIPESIEFEPGKIAAVKGIDDFAFRSSGVISVTIPNSVETIGKMAFNYCSNLTTVKIGTGIKEIMSKAFFPDAKLTTMFIDAVTPPEIASDALTNAPEKITLYVPAEAVESYKNSETWNKIGSIVSQGNIVMVQKITVSPSTANIQEGASITLTATVAPENAEQKVLWVSSNTDIARVSNTGSVFGVKSGVCTISAVATDGSGVKGECTLTVGSGKALEVSRPFISGFVGESYTVSATVAPENTMVMWSVENSAIASLDTDGLYATVNLLSPGTTILTANATNGLSKDIEINVKEMIRLTGIEVNPQTMECEVGDKISLWEFNVAPIPENVSEFSPSITIEDTSIIDYDPEDYDLETFECLAPGTTRLIWSQDGIEGWCTIIVKGDIFLTEIALTPDNVTGEYKAGDRIQITATPIPSNATDFDPEWSSSDIEVATVDNNGLVTIVSTDNEATITCTSGDITASCKLNIKSTGINWIKGEDEKYRVVSIEGTVIYENAAEEELAALLPGIYIINGKKTIVKKAIWK